jgi:hypothetical protein
MTIPVLSTPVATLVLGPEGQQSILIVGPGAQGPSGPTVVINGYNGPIINLIAHDVGAYTQAEVDQKIVALVGGAPSFEDTMAELYAAAFPVALSLDYSAPGGSLITI